MNKLDTSGQVRETINAGFEKLKEQGVDLKEDEFTIIQQFDNGQGIVIRMTEEEGRKLKVDVTDSMVVLPVKTGHLDIYSEESETDGN